MYVIIHTIQFLSFAFSQFTNLILLWLIFKKAKNLLGSFRYLMSTFSIYSMVYNCVDIITHPLVLIEKQLYLVINHGPFRYTDWYGYVLVCMFGASFGLCISLLCTEFIFRYIIICKHHYRPYIDGPKILLLFIFPVIISTTWFFICYFGLTITPEKRQMLKVPFLENYGEDSEKLMFASGLYWSIGKEGKRQWCLKDCLASLGLTGLMVICCSTIFYCGMKTYRQMKDLRTSLSKQTAALNNQLFLTLTLQTILPVVLMYAPVGLSFFLPLFEINLGFLASSAAASTAIYPALEPLIAIFCINLFRNAVICRKKIVSIYDISSMNAATS